VAHALNLGAGTQFEFTANFNLDTTPGTYKYTGEIVALVAGGKDISGQVDLSPSTVTVELTLTAAATPTPTVSPSPTIKPSPSGSPSGSPTPTPPSGITITAPNLPPPGVAGQVYPGLGLIATGGDGVYINWQAAPVPPSPMALPQGLTLDPQQGIIFGTISSTASPGSYPFTVTCQDTSNPPIISAPATFTITVVAASATPSPTATPKGSPSPSPTAKPKTSPTPTPGQKPPSAPSGLTGSVASPTQVNLSWNAVGGATSYNIYLQGNGQTLIGTTNGATTFIYNGAGAGQQCFYVAAVNAGGVSPLSAGACVNVP